MFSHALSLLAGLAAILGFSIWTLSFADSCDGDGCIGIVFLIRDGLIALGVQLLVLVPVDAYRTHKRGEPLGLRVGAWVGLSIAAFIVPLLLLLFFVWS